MRADRLVALLLLLQQRTQVTAAEVAAELEVSLRTARRDLDALAMAGIPVYSIPGRGGGWRLAGGGRTDLSGLTADEARALVLLAGADSATPGVRAAMRKLIRALPEPLRDRSQVALGAVVVDPASWDRPERTEPPPQLDELHRAIVAAEQVRLDYRRRDGSEGSRRVHPLGLARKGDAWYLLARTDDGQRTFRVDRILNVEGTGEPAERPEDFDLAKVWQAIVDHVEHLRAPITARALVDAEMVEVLRAVLGTRVTVGDASAHGRVAVRLRGHTLRSLAGEIAGFGSYLEVLDPPELRALLARIGRELAERHAQPVSPVDSECLEHDHVR